MNPLDKYVDMDHIRLHYLDWGKDGSPVLLIVHGIMGHAHLWDDISQRLCDRYHVIALDQRGHGQSGRPEEAEYAMDDYLKDLSLFIELLDLKKIILLGHSMGGRNGLFYTVCNPEKIHKLILVDARPGNSYQSSKAMQDMFNNIPLCARSLDEVSSKIRRLFPYLSTKISDSMVQYGYTQNDDGHFVPRYDVRMAGLSEDCGYRIDDLWPFLERITCPTLIIRGKESPFFTRDDAETMCSLIPLAVWQEVMDSSHMPAQENPDLFFKILLDFLSCKQ